MSKENELSVTVELGVTFQLKDGTFVKPLLTLNNIDPTADVDKQVNICLEAAQIGLAKIDGQIDISLSEILSDHTGPGYRERVDKLEDVVKRMASALKANGITNGKQKESS